MGTWKEDATRMKKDQSPPGNIDSMQNLCCWALSQLARPFHAPDFVKALLAGLREVTGSVRADLLLYQSDMNVLFFSESVCAGESERSGKKFSLADTKNSVPVEALVGGHTVYVGDVRASGFLSLSPGARAILAIPVTFGDHIHGVLNMEHALAEAYDDESVKWAEALSTVFGVILDLSYSSEQIFRLNQKLLDRMAETAAESDPGFRTHAERVSAIAAALAEEMGLEPEMVKAVRDSGYLHDIGKSGVSSQILVKPGRLSDAEMNEMKRHPVLGRFLLKPLGFHPQVIEGVASHHERWDGTGYPRGLSGNQIPLAGRILAVAEAWDVMTSDQPYRKKLTKEEAIEEIRSQVGRQFDPEIVDALLRLDIESL